MQIHISPNDGVPIYRQIVTQVKYLVACSRLVPGDEMPAIRALADQLIVNPNTVARAYRELERDGILLSRQGSGTQVANGGSPLAETERIRILSERADALIAEARQMDIGIDTLSALLRDRSERMDQPEETPS